MYIGYIWHYNQICQACPYYANPRPIK